MDIVIEQLMTRNDKRIFVFIYFVNKHRSGAYFDLSYLEKFDDSFDDQTMIHDSFLSSKYPPISLQQDMRSTRLEISNLNNTTKSDNCS